MSNQTPAPTHKPKRNDIQGLRAIAIIGVLLFHLAPKRFVNGFLGVDTFFVLSGYLMSSILSREKTIDGRVVRSFYVRRFKRIVPLYSIMLAILAVITPLVFLPSDMSHFVTDLEWALPFAENMQNVLKQFDYWDEVFNSPVLLHAWSLGVEIQYYLIVPLIMIVARFGQTRRFRLITFVVLIGGSYTLHILLPSSFSFGLLFSRVWQFLTGSVFFELEGVVDDQSTTGEYQPVADQEKLLEEEEDSFEDLEIGKPKVTARQKQWSCSFTPLVVVLSYVVTGYLLWMVTMSTSALAISRLLVTFATGNLLLYGKFTQNPILSNDIMVYIGDLSYIVYLAHWPVIILFKYYNDLTDLTVPDASFCLLATLLVSVLLHHSLEQFFIKSSTTIAAVFVAVIYGIIVLALLAGGLLQLSQYAHGGEMQQVERSTEKPQFRPMPLVPSAAPEPQPSPTITSSSPAAPTTVAIAKYDVIRWNQAQSKVVYFANPSGCVRDYEAETWTSFTEEGSLRCVSAGNGTAKVLVMGNSYAYRAFPVLHRLFAGRYAQMRLFSRSSRVFLTKDPESTKYADKERIVVEKFQPDITFFIEKDSFSTLMRSISGTVDSDPITQYVQAAVNVLSNNSGTVVVDRQYYKTHTKDGVAYTIQKRVQQGKMEFDDLSVSRKDYESEFANESARMATIKNENVIVNDVQQQLCPGDRCYFFNRDNLHSYYGDGASHLTSEGLALLELNYTTIIEDFLLRLASRRSETNRMR